MNAVFFTELQNYDKFPVFQKMISLPFLFTNINHNTNMLRYISNIITAYHVKYCYDSTILQNLHKKKLYTNLYCTYYAIYQSFMRIYLTYNFTGTMLLILRYYIYNLISSVLQIIS